MMNTAVVLALSVEVLHWWTSGGEAKALKVLKQEFEAAGGTWADTPIAGGGGDTARSILKSRFASKHPPAAAQLHMGPQVWDWGKEGVLASVDGVARKNGWDTALAPLVGKGVKWDGKFVAAPVNIHRENWLWANPAVFKKHNLKVPTTWAEFNDAADKLKAAGVTPLAHGGQPWQDVVLFDGVALGLGGVDYYRKAFLELDPAVLGGDTTVKVLTQFRKLKSYTDKGAPGRDWNLASAMLIRGEAAMQLQGDWVKGEFLAAGLKPGVDILCLPSPGSAGTFTANNDSFVFFKAADPDQAKAQELLAGLVMGEKFQDEFSRQKGSIPARMDTPMQGFDQCALDSRKALKEATAADKAIPIMNNGTSEAVTGALTDVITAFFNSDMPPVDAAKQLVAAAKSAQTI